MFPTTPNAEGVQIDEPLMNKLFIYNNVPLFLFFAMPTNYKVVVSERTFQSVCILIHNIFNNDNNDDEILCICLTYC